MVYKFIQKATMDKDQDRNEAKFTIEGNPGTGNTFINIGKAINVNPNATTIENKFYFGSDGDMRETALKEPNTPMSSNKKLNTMTLREMLKNDLIDTLPIQKDIMNYVSCIRPYVKADCEKHYMQLWTRLLDHDSMKIDLYDPGKQDCRFNRNLVANIIHYLDGKGFYREQYNSSEMTRAVEGDVDNPVRKAFRSDPDPVYCNIIDELLS